MTLDVRYHPDALAELRADVAWYDERGARLGDRFEVAVDDVLDAILEWPESGAVWPGWDGTPVVRSRRVAGFPYRLVYLIRTTELVVVAVAHQKTQTRLLARSARGALSLVTSYGKRTRKLPAPPHVIWEDLVHPATSGTRVWLNLLDDEVAPRVIESEAPHRVVWSSLWPSRPGDKVLLELADVGHDTTLTFTLLAHGDLPDDSKTGHIRKRVNYLLFSDLRDIYGQ